MKRHSGTMAFIASVLMLPAGLHAADSEPMAKSTSESTPAADAEDFSGKTKDKKVEAARTGAKCEYVTGSRIRRDPKVDCEDGSPGLRVYSSEELQRTGEGDINKALRKLDTRMR